MTMLAASLPPISQDFFDKIRKSHPPLMPIPGVTTLDEIWFEAGRQELIEWIRVHGLRDSIVTSADLTDRSKRR